MMHSHNLFQIFPPNFRKNFRLCGKFPKYYLFPTNFWFSSAFFSHRPQTSNFPPIFHVLVHVPPVSQKIIISPLLSKIPPLFSKNVPAFHMLYVYFVFPYFEHDARTGRPCASRALKRETVIELLKHLNLVFESMHTLKIGFKCGRFLWFRCQINKLRIIYLNYYLVT